MEDGINNLSEEELGKLFPVTLSEYDPAWSDMYREEMIRIIDSLGPDSMVTTKHIGSTAIPGMCAKPTIDILLEVLTTSDDKLIVASLRKAGYSYIPKPDNPPPYMMFAKGYSMKGYSGQAYHLHVRYPGIHDEVLFRDYLIRNTGAAKEYADLKRRLAKDFKNNREKYTNGKSEFVKQIITAAKRQLSYQ